MCINPKPNPQLQGVKSCVKTHLPKGKFELHSYLPVTLFFTFPSKNCLLVMCDALYSYSTLNIIQL